MLRGQTAQPDRPLEFSLDLDLLRDLPASGNLFSILEAAHEQVTSDRFYTGGLSTGEPPRLGAQLASPAQNQFRIGDVDITDPNGSGAPMLFPELLYWQHIGILTGAMPATLNAPGLAVTLEPRRPTERWTGMVEGLGSPGWVASPSASEPPPIARLDKWGRGAAIVAGPAGRARVALGASLTRGSQFVREGSAPVDGSVGSGFGNFIFARTPRDEIRLLGWAQRAEYPFSEQQPTRSSRDTAVHVQSTWNRQLASTGSWRLFGGLTRRASDLDATPAFIVIDRLLDGPVPEYTSWRHAVSSRLSAGTRIVPAVRTVRRRRHTTEIGGEIARTSGVFSTPFTGWIGELVDGNPARAWRFSAGTADSHRSTTSVTATASDGIELTPRVTLAVGLQFDATRGSAEGALTDVRWMSWLPQAQVRWRATERARITVYGGYRRAADRLLLDTLAVGNPSERTADIYRWNAFSGSAPSAPPGPLVARAGPGTAGDPAFSRIDPELRRPVTDELVIGMESYLSPAFRWQVMGLARWERNDLALRNVGVGPQDYSTFTVPNPGGAVTGPSFGSTEPITVYDRLAPSFGRDRYLLTNSTLERPRLLGVDVNLRLTLGRLWLTAAGMAQLGNASAGYRGFRANENDQGVLGDVLADPNSAAFAYGRPFLDRGFTGKVTLTYRLPKDIRLGALVRYQDGQPFSGLMVIRGLGQGADIVRAFENGGTRFTYVGTLDVRLQKGFDVGGRRIDAILDAYNLSHLRNEVEERPVIGPSFRMTTAIQPPLAVHIGARFTF